MCVEGVEGGVSKKVQRGGWVRRNHREVEINHCESTLQDIDLTFSNQPSTVFAPGSATKNSEGFKSFRACREHAVVSRASKVSRWRAQAGLYRARGASVR